MERFLVEAEERGNAFFFTLLEKQNLRMKGIFERHVVCILYLFAIRYSIFASFAERADQIGRGHEIDE